MQKALKAIVFLSKKFPESLKDKGHKFIGLLDNEFRLKLQGDKPVSHHNGAKAIPDIFSYREFKLGTRPVENSTPCVCVCVCVYVCTRSVASVKSDSL